MLVSKRSLAVRTAKPTNPLPEQIRIQEVQEAITYMSNPHPRNERGHPICNVIRLIKPPTECHLERGFRASRIAEKTTSSDCIPSIDRNLPCDA